MNALYRFKLDPDGPYELTRCLNPGRGDDVFLVIHTETARKYIARLYENEEASDREKNCLGMMGGHYQDRSSIPFVTHLVDLLRVYQEDERTSRLIETDCWCLLTEFVEGEPLSSWRAKQSEVTNAEAIRMFRRLVSTLSQVHERGIAHRDIKPGNIIVDANGDPHFVDFGSAVYASTAPDADPTEGSLLWLPPELAALRLKSKVAEVRLDSYRRADVYAIGAVLYFLLTGSRPYVSEEEFSKGELDEQTIVKRIREGRLRPILRLGAKADAKLIRISRICMAPDPLVRPDSASEVRTVLERLEVWENTRRIARNVLVGVAFVGITIAGLVGLNIMQRAAYRANQEQVTRLVEKGWSSIEEGNYVFGLHHFREAYELDRDDEANVEHQQRIGIVKQWTPRVLHRFQSGDYGQTIDFASEANLLIVTSPVGRVTVFELAQQPPRKLQQFETKMKPLDVFTSSDGQMVLLDEGNGSLIMHDARTSEQIHSALLGVSATAAAISPDGRFVAWAVHQREQGREAHVILLKPLADRKSLVRPILVDRRVNSLVFSPESSMLSAGLGDERTAGAIYTWDVASVTNVASCEGFDNGPGDDVRVLRYLANGEQLVSGSHDGQLMLWDAESLRRLAAPMRHRKYIRSLSISPDDSIVLATSDDEVAVFWDLSSGTNTLQLDDLDGTISTAEFIGSQKAVLSTRGGSCRVVELSHLPQQTVLPHGEHIERAISLDGHRIATLSRRGEITIWHCPPLIGPIASIDLGNSVEHLDYHPELGRVVVADSAYDLTLFALQDNTLRQLSTVHVEDCDRILGLRFTPDGQGVLVETMKSPIRQDLLMWRIDGSQPASLLPPNDEPRFVHLCDNRMFITEPSRGDGRLYQLNKEQLTAAEGSQLDDQSDSTIGWGVPQQDGTVAIGRLTGTLGFYDASEQAVKKQLDLGGGILRVASSDDGSVIAGIVSPADTSLVIIDARQGTVRHQTYPFDAKLDLCRMSPDGHYIAAADNENGLCIIDVRDKKFVAAKPWMARTNHNVLIDNKALPWNSGGDEPLRIKLGDRVRSIAFSADSQFFAVAIGTRERGSFGQAIVYAVRSGRQVSPPLPHGDDVLRAIFTESGDLLTTSYDGHLRLWKMGNRSNRAAGGGG